MKIVPHETFTNCFGLDDIVSRETTRYLCVSDKKRKTKKLGQALGDKESLFVALEEVSKKESGYSQKSLMKEMKRKF